MLTTPKPHYGPTSEELAKRARCRELREQIAEEATDRRVIKAAYRVPHLSPEHKVAMAAARAHLGIVETEDTFRYNWHSQPGRDYGRDTITALHVELATLRGKVHGPVLV